MGSGNALYGNYTTGQMPKGVVWPFLLGKEVKMKRGSFVVSLCLILFWCVGAGTMLFCGIAQTVFAQAVDDTTPPELIAFNFEPKIIDVSAGPASVTFTLTIIDDLSGFDWACFYFVSPSGEQYQGRCVNSNDLTDEINKVYTVIHEFPEHMEAGTWRLDGFDLADKVTNQRYYINQDLIDAGFPTDLEVISVEDVTGPVLNSFDFSPKENIDAGTAPVNITFNWNLTDDISGVMGGGVTFMSPSGNQYFSGWCDSYYIDENGDCTVTEQLPQYAEIGVWSVIEIYLYDNVGNYTDYNQSEIQALGFPTTFEVTSLVDDKTPPVLHDLSIDPIVINTIQGPDSATFILELTDNLSGFYWGCLDMTSPSGGQYQSMCVHHPYNLVDGSLNLYQNSIQFPRYSEFGEWTVQYISVGDKTGNYKVYSHQDLVDMGLPATVLMEGVEHSGEFPVGPEGGVINPEDDDILSIVIPAGAVDENVVISISKIGRFEPVDILIGSDPGQGQTLAEYDFGPEGMVFNEPLIVTMVVDVTELNQTERDSLNIFQHTDTDGDGTDDTFLPVGPEHNISIETTVNPDGTVLMTFTMELDHFSTYAVILPLVETVDTTPPTIGIVVPEAHAVVQDGVKFKAVVTDESSIGSVSFTIRKADGNDGVIIGLEQLAATYNDASGYWELDFNSANLLDGYYIIFANAVDQYGNEGECDHVPFVIRNWSVLSMLPESKEYRAGRTMPLKFTLRLMPEVDPLTPFVYNEDLVIIIYETNDPGNILQKSVYGDKSSDYRIDTVAEKYITNFKTDKKPTHYTVEILRQATDFLVGSFTFETQR